MKALSYLVIGGDKRQEFVFKALKEKGKDTEIIYKAIDGKISYDLTKIKDADIIILPTPLTKDSKTVFCECDKKLNISEVAKMIKEKALVFSGGEHPEIEGSKATAKINILKDEEMTLKNAMATAEATLKIIIENTDYTLKGSKITLLGFGRIGKFLSYYLKTLGASLTVVARKAEVRAEAQLKGYFTADFSDIKGPLKSADIVINTVPFLVLDEKTLRDINKDALIIDLASKPGGVDFEAASKLGIKALQALSLPGKYSPKSAAEYIVKSVENTVNIF